MAAEYAQNNVDNLEGLILFASYPANNEDFIDFPIPILSISGSRDPGAPNQMAFSDAVAGSAERFVIEGGNHRQYADYAFQPADGIATISAAEQQDQIIAATVQFLDTLDYINPSMNQQELVEKTMTYMGLIGNAYWYILKNRLGVAEAIWSMPAEMVTIVPGTEKLILGYMFQTPDGTKVSFTDEEVIHFKYPNPFSLFYGMSPIQAMLRDADRQENLDNYSDFIFKNRGRPDVKIEYPENISIDYKERDRLAMEWRRNYRGTSKAGKAAILDRGGKASAFSNKPIETDYIEDKRLTREAIAATYGMSVSLLVGGAARDIYEKKFLEPRAKAESWPEQKKTMKLLQTFMIATGLLVGEALMGTIIALYLVIPLLVGG